MEESGVRPRVGNGMSVLVALVLFGVSFGYIEAAVVVFDKKLWLMGGVAMFEAALELGIY